jgi:hypothetical protein
MERTSIMKGGRTLEGNVAHTAEDRFLRHLTDWQRCECQCSNLISKVSSIIFTIF